MRTTSILFLLPLLVSCGSTVNGTLPGAPPLEAVPALDLGRYLGKWYEIAKYPVTFEEGLFSVTAEYSLRKDGKIRVVNSGNKGDPTGKLTSIEGKAWIPDPREPAKLKVQFFWPFSADYWVIALAPDYGWAVIGEPDRSYLWILSRTPSLPDAEYAAILERTEALGYDTSLLELMPQVTDAPASTGRRGR
jgi:lipocalin